ncbi:MAG: SCO family protein [Vibrio sp.]
MKKSWIVLLIVAFAFGVGLNLYLDGRKQVDGQTYSYQLLGENNQSVDIFNVADDRIRVLYFGFTRCPDVCPTSLAMLSAAMKQMSPEETKHIRPIFITLDPERDSGDDAQKYAHYFYPTFEGYSGQLDTIQSLATHYGVIFQKTKLKDSALNYTIDHSSYFYFLKPDGTLLKKVPHTLNPQPLILAIQELEKENQ